MGRICFHCLGFSVRWSDGIDTAMTRSIAPADMQSFVDETPMERMGTVEEMADWLYFITCVDSFSTGQVFSPNGGVVI